MPNHVDEIMPSEHNVKLFLLLSTKENLSNVMLRIQQNKKQHTEYIHLRKVIPNRINTFLKLMVTNIERK